MLLKPIAEYQNYVQGNLGVGCSKPEVVGEIIRIKKWSQTEFTKIEN